MIKRPYSMFRTAEVEATKNSEQFDSDGVQGKAGESLNTAKLSVNTQNFLKQ